jgi:hypothetical protein
MRRRSVPVDHACVDSTLCSHRVFPAFCRRVRSRPGESGQPWSPRTSHESSTSNSSTSRRRSASWCTAGGGGEAPVDESDSFFCLRSLVHDLLKRAYVAPLAPRKRPESSNRTPSVARECQHKSCPRGLPRPRQWCVRLSVACKSGAPLLINGLFNDHGLSSFSLDLRAHHTILRRSDVRSGCMKDPKHIFRLQVLRFLGLPFFVSCELVWPTSSGRILSMLLVRLRAGVFCPGRAWLFFPDLRSGIVVVDFCLGHLECLIFESYTT